MGCPRSLVGNMKSGRKTGWLLAAAIAVVLGAFVAFLWDGGGPQTSNKASSEIPRAAGSIGAGLSDSPPIDRPVGSDSAWVVVDPATVDELPPYKEEVAGRALVRVSDALRLGVMTDRVVMAVPQVGQIYEGVIEVVETDPWGNISYVGLIRDVDDRDYRFLITAGARNTFAHIGTSRGTFELVVTGGTLGWLMPSVNMDQHVDYSKPDYYIVDEKPRLQEDDTAP